MGDRRVGPSIRDEPGSCRVLDSYARLAVTPARLVDRARGCAKSKARAPRWGVRQNHTRVDRVGGARKSVPALPTRFSTLPPMRSPSKGPGLGGYRGVPPPIGAEAPSIVWGPRWGVHENQKPLRARLLILGTLDAEALRAEAAHIRPHAPPALVHGNDRRELHHAARAAPPASVRIDARAWRVQADGATGQAWECPSFHARIVARIEGVHAALAHIARIRDEARP